jgi:hypothetical protein
MKQFRFVGVAWVCLTCSGAAEAQTAPPAPTSAPPESSEVTVDADAVGVAVRIVAAKSALGTIWPGYWPPSQAFIINVPGAGALLIADATPDAPGWRPVSAAQLPAILRGRAYFRPDPIEGSSRPFITAFPIGGDRTAIFVNASQSAIETATLILHEQFHDHQKLAFRGTAPQFVSPLAVPDRASFATLAEVERRILAAALAAKGAKRTGLLREYFAVRRQREEQVAPEVRSVERGFERLEGTARYVDRLARIHIFGEGDFERLLIEDLGEDLLGRAGAFTTIWFRSRSYATGAALTWLLSQEDPSGWRAAIEGGGDPASLLDQRLGAAGNAAAALRRYGYEDLLQQMREPIREAERSEIKTAEDFLGLGAHAITVHFAPRGAGGSAFSPSFSAREMAMLSPSVLALRVADVFTVSGKGAELVARQRPVMMDSSGGGRRVVILLDEPPAINDQPGFAPGVHRLPNLVIDQGGLQLRLDGPVEVRVDAKGTVIRPLPEN